MQFIMRLAGTLLLAIAFVWVLAGLGNLDSPEMASGQLIGILLPAAFFSGLGLWCWQKPKSKQTSD